MIIRNNVPQTSTQYAGIVLADICNEIPTLNLHRYLDVCIGSMYTLLCNVTVNWYQ